MFCIKKYNLKTIKIIFMRVKHIFTQIISPILL